MVICHSYIKLPEGKGWHWIHWSTAVGWLFHVFVDLGFALCQYLAAAPTVFGFFACLAYSVSKQLNLTGWWVIIQNQRDPCINPLSTIVFASTIYGPYLSLFIWLVVWNMFSPYFGNILNWLIFFRGVETTNQLSILVDPFWFMTLPARL